MVRKLGNNPKFSPLASKRTQKIILKMSRYPVSQYLKNRRNGEGGGGTPKSLQNYQFENYFPLK